MKLAAVGFSNDSGVGRELVSAARQLPISGVYVLHNPLKPTRIDLLPTSSYFISNDENQLGNMTAFLDKYRPDTILTWEGPGVSTFPGLWKLKGIRWINVVHWDWFNPQGVDAWHDAELIAPNQMCQRLLKEEYRLDSMLLPVPVDTERLPFRKRIRADTFISVYGYGGPHNRRSLPEIFLAWSEIANPPPLVIKAQVSPPELDRYMPPAEVTISVANLSEPGDLYQTGDVAVQLSRYEGIGISFLEAMACGLPVITTNAAPMNEIAPELCVPVDETGSVPLAGKSILSSTPSIAGIREIVEYLRGRDISELSERVRWRVEKYYSWKALRPRWMELLT